MRISLNVLSHVLISFFVFCQIAKADPAPNALPTTRLSAPLPTEVGHFRLRYLVNIKGAPRDLCLVVSNSKKVAESKTKIPVLIFLCGADERGTNGDLMFAHGPSAAMIRDAKLNDSMPMMIVSPQFPMDLGIGGPKLGPETVVQLKDLIAADPRVALSIVDGENPYRNAQLRGRVVETVEGADALVVIDRISQRYIGKPFPMRSGTVYWIEPETAHFVELPFSH